VPRAKRVPDVAQKVFGAHLNQLKRLVDARGTSDVASLYADAQRDLAARLRAAGEGSTKAGPTTLRAMIAQADAAVAKLSGKLEQHLNEASSEAVVMGARHGLDEWRRLETHFKGTTPVLDVERGAMFRGLVNGVDRSVLNRHKRSVQIWGLDAIRRIEGRLSVAAMTGKPLEDMVEEVMRDDGLGPEERYRAERIVRTEMAHAHGAAKHQAIERTAKELGGKVWKKLIATFDDRTGDDSFLVHGQAVPVDQPFQWKRKVRGRWVLQRYMHPPNRPNDREVVVPWDPSWPEDDLSRPLSLTELEAAEPTRWRKDVGVEIPPGHKPGQPYEHGPEDEEGEELEAEQDGEEPGGEAADEELAATAPFLPEPGEAIEPEESAEEPAEPEVEEEDQEAVEEEDQAEEEEAGDARADLKAEMEDLKAELEGEIEDAFEDGAEEPVEPEQEALEAPQAAVEAATALVGRPVSAAQVAALTGFEGAKVRVKVGPMGRVKITAEAPHMHAIRDLVRVDGKLVLKNGLLEVEKEAQGQSRGTRLFASQIRAAVSLGVDRIEALCFRSGNYNGYYTWARLGYDAPLDAEQRRATGCESIAELMQTAEGRAWWKTHGDSFDGVFDLSPGSRSRKVLSAYLREKGIDPKKPHGRR